MDEPRTKRQLELERLRCEQREDLGAVRAAGVKPFLTGAPEGLIESGLSTIAELAIRREAHTRRTGAVTQTIALMFAHLDSRAVIDVVQHLHGTSAATQAIVMDIQHDLYEREAPVLDADVLGPYVVLIEAAEFFAPDAPPSTR